MKRLADGARGRVLVTGGAGFVGAHLAARLLEDGREVTVADLVPYETRTPLRALGLATRVSYVQADVRDPATLMEGCGGGYDVIFHLAAQPISPLSNLAPDETLSMNVVGTQGAVTFVQRGGARALVLASSACAYGVPDPQDCPLTEDAPLRDGCYVYTASKQQAEQIVRTGGIRAGIARMVNLFGPADWHTSRIVPRMIHQLMRDEPLTLRRSSGDSVLDFLYVGDAVEGLLALADRVLEDEPRAEVPVYNFGASQPVRIREFAASIPPLFDGRERAVHAALVASEPAMSKYLDSGRARRELGWAPRVPREAALRETIEWYRHHADELEHLDTYELTGAAA